MAVDDIANLLESTAGLAARLAANPLDAVPNAAERLTASVLRPLGWSGSASADRTADLSELAESATRLAVRPDAPSALLEAAAALQDLACRAGDDDTAARLDALCKDMPTGIRVSTDGPYLAVGGKDVSNYLGEPVPYRPIMALCRCGKSGMKPFCDGTHRTVGFTGEKDPNRVPDRRDSYDGVQVTVLDNRGICAHSGLCTDRLSTVFHAGSEPFVTPSGGRMDEIIRAVRDCPSGALSFAIDGREAREEVDQAQRGPAIMASQNGPYRVTGAIPLTDDDGADVPRVGGSSREHYSLCRCGQSQNKPFCSGMHYYVNFTDPEPDPTKEPTLFEWAGGYPALLRMTRLFYERYVPEDPLLAPLFAAMSPDHPERVAAWLSEVFGGPHFYSELYGDYNRMISHHVGKRLTEDQRARWVALLSRSAQDAGLPADAEFRAAFVAYLEWGSRIAVENSQQDAAPPPNMPIPHWWWVCDATPGSRISALAPEEETASTPDLPGAGDALSYDAHIKNLFRPMDRNSMKFVFDLWSYSDVRQHSAAILDRLRAGSMPCDGPWPAERVDVFARWIDSGTPE